MRMQPIESIDLATTFFFSTHRVGWLSSVMIAITALGWIVILALLAGALTVVLWVWRGPRTAILFAVTSVLAWSLCALTQLAVNRPRPDVAYELIPRPTMPSFPSGHAMDSVAVYGLFAVLLTRGMPAGGLRFTIRCLGFLLPFAIGVSRLYLTVHFLSDVLAGWLGGLALVLIAWSLDRPPAPRPDEPLAK
jgi:undecaprenyl-diphosphatase